MSQGSRYPLGVFGDGSELTTTRRILGDPKPNQTRRSPDRIDRTPQHKKFVPLTAPLYTAISRLESAIAAAFSVSFLAMARAMARSMAAGIAVLVMAGFTGGIEARLRVLILRGPADLNSDSSRAKRKRTTGRSPNERRKERGPALWLGCLVGVGLQGPCSATMPATARSADLQRPVVTKGTSR